MGDIREVSLRIEDAEIDNGKVWFFACDFNGLFSKNIDDGKVEFWGSIPGEEMEHIRLYSAIKKYENKIFLIPNKAKELAIFDIGAKCCTKINLDEGIGYSGHIQYMSVAQHEDWLYLWGLTRPIIVRLNVYTYEIEMVKDLEAELKQLGYKREKLYFRKQIEVMDGKIYAPLSTINALVELDCDTLQIQIHALGEKKEGYAGICKGGNNEFCLTPMYYSGDIVLWNKESGSIKRILPIQGQEEFAYVAACALMGKYVLFPALHCAPIYDKKSQLEIAEGNYLFAKQDQNLIIAYENNKGTICIFDQEGNKREIDTQVSVEYTREIQMIWNARSTEKRGVTLEFFLDVIQRQRRNEINMDEQGTTGEKIYSILK